MYFDGQRINPYFKRVGFSSSLKDPNEGGVDNHLAAKTTRANEGTALYSQMRTRDEEIVQYLLHYQALFTHALYQDDLS